MLFRSVLSNLLAIFLLFVFSLILLLSESRHYIISILLNMLRRVLWEKCDLSWLMFTLNLRRICILLLEKVVYRCQLYPTDR